MHAENRYMGILYTTTVHYVQNREQILNRFFYILERVRFPLLYYVSLYTFAELYEPPFCVSHTQSILTIKLCTSSLEIFHVKVFLPIYIHIY